MAIVICLAIAYVCLTTAYGLRQIVNAPELHWLGENGYKPQLAEVIHLPIGQDEQRKAA